MKNRARTVIIQDSQVVLIKRIRAGRTYYVFPGGGLKEGETPKQAAEREAFEELGVRVQATELIATIDHDGRQFFFAANILAGTIGTGTGEEFTDPIRDRGTYEPLWIAIEQLAVLDIRPKAIGSLLTKADKNDAYPG